MRKIKSFLRLLLIVGFFINLPFHAFAQSNFEERIIDYHSDIIIHEDSTLTVTETIKVWCEGLKIQRGIYREFPTKYKDRLGNRVIVGFEVIEVLRDGKPEPYFTKPMSNGKAVYIGKDEVFLKTGQAYTYTLKYKTDRQLGFFEEHDELYFNATGNGWDFIIENASATVTLPEGITEKDIELVGYTGFMGETGSKFNSRVGEDGKAYFESDTPLLPRQGLTIVVMFPKGFVAEPTLEEKSAYFFRDNISVFIGIITIAILLIYYLFFWSRYGKDLPKGIIIPQFEPPMDLSPAAVRYIKRMGYDNKVFSAALINMAVKGFTKINNQKRVFSLDRTGEIDKLDKYDLSVEEKIIADKLLKSQSHIKLQNTNHVEIASAIQFVQKMMRTYYENRYFKTNTAYLIPGVLISLVSFFAMTYGVFEEGGEESVVLFVMGSIFSTIGFTIFGVIGIPAFRDIFSRGGSCIASCVSIFFGTIFLVTFGGFGLVMFLLKGNIFMGLFIGAFLFINLLFYHLMKAPTQEGRRILDHIDGFKMYLSFAEKDRLNTLNPPEKTPELFEKYLPYALALDVEQQWSEEFSDVLESSTHGESKYSPSWYSGSNFHNLGASGFASSIGSSVSGAISSSSHAPGSSSGGGGGGSSGGGGGGGGGW